MDKRQAASGKREMGNGDVGRGKWEVGKGESGKSSLDTCWEWD